MQKSDFNIKKEDVPKLLMSAKEIAKSGFCLSTPCNICPANRIFRKDGNAVCGPFGTGNWNKGNHAKIEWFKEFIKLYGGEMNQEENMKGKEKKIAELQEEMQRCCKKFQKKIDELKKPEFVNPIDLTGREGKYGLRLPEEVITFNNVETLNQVGNFYTLMILMLHDSFEDWQGEPDWTNNERKWGLTCVYHKTEKIWKDYYYNSRFSIIPAYFKTEESLTASIQKHRELFDEVFDSKGYVIS